MEQQGEKKALPSKPKNERSIQNLLAVRIISPLNREDIRQDTSVESPVSVEMAESREGLDDWNENEAIKGMCASLM